MYVTMYIQSWQLPSVLLTFTDRQRLLISQPTATTHISRVEREAASLAYQPTATTHSNLNTFDPHF